MAKRGRAVRKPASASKRPAAKRRAPDSVTNPEKIIATLRGELRQALERQKATSDILNVINRSAFELQSVLDTIVQTASRLCDAEYALIYKREGDEYRVAATTNTAPDFVSYATSHPIRPGRGTLIGRTALEQKIVHLPDCLADPEYVALEYQSKGKYRTMLGVPLQREGVPIGVIALMRSVVKPFTEGQIELVSTFADQAVIAIENVRLFDEVQTRTNDLAESLQQQTATADVLKVISRSTFDLQTVLDKLTESAAHLCNADMGAIARKDERGFYHATNYNFAIDWVRVSDIYRIQPGRGGVIGRTLLANAAVQIPDVLADPEYAYPDMQQVAGYRTLLGVPMLRGKEPIGVLFLGRKTAEPFTDKQIELVQTFADQAVIAIENVRLFDEVRTRTDDLRESLQQQTATADVLKVISRSAFNLQTVLDTLVESATRLCDARDAIIFLASGETYRAQALHGYSTEYHKFIEANPIAIDRGSVVGRTAIDKRVVHVPDVLADSNYTRHDAQRMAGYRTALGVPLLRQGNVAGVIFLTRTEPQPFSQKQIELITTFADQAVIAIENVRLFDEVQARSRELAESLEQQTATSDVLQVISRSTGKLEPVFSAILANATHLCEAKFGHLFLCEEGDFRVVALQSGAANYPNWLKRGQKLAPLDNPHGPLAQLLQTKKILHIADLAAEPAYIEGNARMVALVESSGARTFLGVPIFKEEALIGAIAIYRQEVRAFTDKQIELVQNFAAQAVIAIENTRLLDELRESLQQQTATADVLKVISRSVFDLQSVLDTLVESAARLCGAEMAALNRPAADVWSCVATYGFGTDAVRLLKNIPVSQGKSSISGRVVARRSVVHIEDVQNDPEYGFTGPQKLSGYRTLLGIPLMRNETPIGVLVLARTHVQPFTDKQIELVTTFADQAVIAIENARLFDEVEARTEDLRESLQQQTATADVLKVISRSTFDLETVLRTLVESAARLCEADKGTITRQRDGAFYRAESFGFSREFMDHVRNIPVAADRGSATGRALLEGVAVHIPDVQADADYHFDDALRLGNYRTLLAVPMMREGTPSGVLTLTRSEARPFTEKQIELVTTFADQAAIAIENVRLFDQVRERTRELSQSLDELRAAQDRLIQTEKLASLGQLTAGIAHEIKNPLNFVNNFSALSVELVDELDDVLQPVTLDHKTREETSELTKMLKDNLEKVIQHGKRADSIVKNMLLHSREGAGERRPVDLNSLVAESLNLAYHGARAEKQGFQIRLDQNFDPAAGEIELFPQEITRVLLNLISNGFYAAMKRKAEVSDGYEPTLVAATRNLGDHVEIRIRDNGRGIPPEVKEKMFNPFFTTKPPGEGTGLGLSLSYDIIVKQHAGSIEVYTEPNEFTEFRVILPRRAATSRSGAN